MSVYSCPTLSYIYPHIHYSTGRLSYPNILHSFDHILSCQLSYMLYLHCYILSSKPHEYFVTWMILPITSTDRIFIQFWWFKMLVCVTCWRLGWPMPGWAGLGWTGLGAEQLSFIVLENWQPLVSVINSLCWKSHHAAHTWKVFQSCVPSFSNISVPLCRLFTFIFQWKLWRQYNQNTFS